MMGDDTFSVVSGSSTQGSSPLLFSTLRCVWANKQKQHLNEGNLSPVIPSQNINNIEAVKNDHFASTMHLDLLLREDSERIPMDSQTDLFESQQSLNNIDCSVGQSSGISSFGGACGPHVQHQAFTSLMKNVPDPEENSLVTECKAGRHSGAEEDAKSVSSQSTLPPGGAVPLVLGIKDVLEQQCSSHMLKNADLCSNFKSSPSNNMAHPPDRQHVKDNTAIVNAAENPNNTVEIQTALSSHSNASTPSLHKENNISSCNLSMAEAFKLAKQICYRSNSIRSDNDAVASCRTEKIDTDLRGKPLKHESRNKPIDIRSGYNSENIQTKNKSLQIHQTEVDTLCRLIKIYDTALKKIEQKRPTAAHLDKLQHITQQLAKGQEEEKVRLNVLSMRLQSTGSANHAMARCKYELKLKLLEERRGLLNTAQSNHREILERISFIEARDEPQHCVTEEFKTAESCQISTPGQVSLQECSPVEQGNINDNKAYVEVHYSIDEKCSSKNNGLTPRHTQSSGNNQELSRQVEVLDEVASVDTGLEHCDTLQACTMVSVASQSNESDVVSDTIQDSGGSVAGQPEHNNTKQFFTDHCYIVQKEGPPVASLASNPCVPAHPIIVTSTEVYDAVHFQTLSSDQCSSVLESNAAKKELVTQAHTASGYLETCQSSQQPPAEVSEAKGCNGNSLNSHATVCHNYVEDVGLVIEVTGDSVAQSVNNSNISSNQDGSRTFKVTQFCQVDKQLGPAVQACQDDQCGMQENSCLRFIKPHTEDTIKSNSVADSHGVQISHIPRPSRPPSPSSTVSSSLFPVSSKELLRRIEIRSAGHQPFKHLLQPALWVECGSQTLVTENIKTSTPHRPPKHTLPLAIATDTDPRENYPTKKVCVIEQTPGNKCSDHPHLKSQPLTGTTLSTQQANVTTTLFSKDPKCSASKFVPHHGAGNASKHAVNTKPLRKRGRPKKELSFCVGNSGTSKNLKTSAQSIRKYFPIVIEHSPVKCTDQSLANPLRVSSSGHVISMTQPGNKAESALYHVPASQPAPPHNPAARIVESVELIADAEVTNSSGDFPGSFWQENFGNITMSMAFWESLDVW